jgi:hypothetical protein
VAKLNNLLTQSRVIITCVSHAGAVNKTTKTKHMKVFKSILGVITWPYRTAHDFVDSRPSANQIKTHLQRHTPVIEKTNDGALVSLQLVGTDVVQADVLSFVAETEAALPLTYARAEGVVEGYQLALRSVETLKRSAFAEDTRLIRATVKAEQAEATSSAPDLSELQSATAGA